MVGGWRRLLRLTGRRLVATGRGRSLRAELDGLLKAIGEEILAGDDFRGAVAELAAAMLVSGAEAQSSEFNTSIVSALAAEGWRTANGALSERELLWTVSDFLRVAEATGLLLRTGPRKREWTLTPVGRYALVAGLRARAIARVRGL